MMEKDYFEEEKYARAQKRVKDIKGFYWHLFWYLVVNIFITFGGTIRRMFFDGEIHFYPDFGIFSVWFFWGIGLVSHWIGVFGKNLVFSKNWEERKIKKYMDEDSLD